MKQGGLTRKERLTRAMTDVRNLDRKPWWRIFQTVKKHFDETGEFKSPDRKNHWVDVTRKNWEEGKLSNEQILALKSVGFPFLRGSLERKPVAGDSLKRTIELHQKFKDAAADESNEEYIEYQRLMNNYRSRYSGGLLSEKTARKLDIF